MRACEVKSEKGVTDKSHVLNDERVEVFLFPPNSVRYYCWEVNRACQAFENSAMFIRQFDNTWRGNAKLEFRAYTPPSTDEKKGPSPAGSDALSGFMLISIPWTDVGVADVTSTTKKAAQFRIGLHRAQTFPIDGSEEPGFIWTTWIDPMQSDVNFHCPQCFGSLELDGVES